MKDMDKIVIILVILAIISIGSSVMYFGNTRAIDAESYIQLAYFIQGKDAPLIEHFAARPLVPALAASLNNFFDINTSFGIINTLFIFLTSLVLFMTFSKLFNSIKLGFISALLYPLSFPIILLGSQVLTDAAGYFFLALAIYYIEFHFAKLNLKSFLIIAVIIALGLLARDSSIILFIFLALTILINKHKQLKKKFSVVYKFILAFILALLPFSIWKYITNVRTYPIITRIKDAYANIFTLKYFFSAIFRSILAFHILWLPAIHGFFIDKDRKRRIFYAKMLLTILPLMIIAYLTLAQNFNYDLRHTFALFPLVFPLAAYSIAKIDERFKSRNFLIAGFIILYAVISFVGAALVPETPIRDSLIDLKILQNLASFI